MADAIGSLNIEVTVELAKMQVQFDDLAKRTKALNAKVNSEFRSMTRGIKSLMSSFGVVLAPAALISFGKSVVELGGQINDLSTTAGINSSAFQALSLHFMDSGVSMEELSRALVLLRKNTQEAIGGNAAMKQSFAALGIDPARLQALAMERQIEALAVSIVNATDQNAAFNASLDILGTKNAPKLLASLKELGVGGLDKIAESFKSAILSPAELKTLDDAGDKLARILTIIKLTAAQGLVGTSNFLGDAGAMLAAGEGFAPIGTDPRTLMPTAPSVAGAPAFDGSKIQQAVAPFSSDFKEQGHLGLSATSRAMNEDLITIGKEFRTLTEIAAEAKAGVVTDFSAMAAAAGTFTENMGINVNAENAITDFFSDLDQLSEDNAKSLKEVAHSALEFGDAFSSAFEDAIIQGKKFSDVLQGIAQDILRIALRSAITEPIGKKLGTWFSSLKFFADGGEPPVGVPSIVGERGPELFVPKTAGTIIPNGALGGSKSSGGTYYIDARGADRSGLAELSETIRRLNGSIEARALGAVMGARRRGAMA